MTDVMQDLLIDFDEMGFAPTTACPNPDKYACEWKEKLIAEINRQQEQIESAANGQETLQKALAEKDREIERLTAEKEQLIKTFGECQAEATRAFLKNEKEIERLKNELFCVANERDSIADCINEAVEEAKAEAIKECIEKTQAFLAIKCRGVVEDNPNLDEILWGYRREDVDEFFDNLAKEMIGE